MNWKWPEVWADERGGWWRLVVAICLYMLFGMIVAPLTLGALELIFGLREATRGLRIDVRMAFFAFAYVVPALMAAIGCMLALKFLHRKPLACAFTDGRPFQWGLLFRSAQVSGVLWVIGVVFFPGGLDVVERRLGEFPLKCWPGFCLAIFACIALQAASEEFFNRGYLQPRIDAWLKRPWLSVVLSTTLFTALHQAEMSPAALARVFILGLAMGFSIVRSGTIAPAIGLHWVENSCALCWLPDWTNATTTWLETTYTGVQLVIWSAWMFWATREGRTIERQRISLA